MLFFFHDFAVLLFIFFTQFICQIKSFVPTQTLQGNSSSNSSFGKRIIKKNVCSSSFTRQRPVPYNKSSRRNSNTQNIDDNIDLLSTLQKFNLDKGLVVLKEAKEKSESQPIICEAFANGELRFGIITGLKPPSNNNNKNSLPLFHISMISIYNGGEGENDSYHIDRITVDLGQITTIWVPNSTIQKNTKQNEPITLLLPTISSSTKPSKNIKIQENLLLQEYSQTKKMLQDGLLLNVNQAEVAMQNLYKSRNNSPRRNPGITKKQINQYSKNERLQDILRKALKAGGIGMSKLVSSLDSMEYVYNDSNSNEAKKKRKGNYMQRRIIGAEVLAQDAGLGGRYKRMPCVYVCSNYIDSDGKQHLESVTLLNGGWITTDNNVRTGTEARKFAERASATTDDGVASSQKKTKVAGASSSLITDADERIAQRLESFAMGETFVFSQQRNKNSGVMIDESQLELDVRAALTSMDLPITSEGARDALIRIGRWSVGEKDSRSNNRKANELQTIEPWSNKTLQAAKALVIHEQKRQHILQDQLSKLQEDQSSPEQHKKMVYLEGRKDLTKLPVVCIDAKGTSFRDDAIGLRPRSVTGRKVNTEASKWEILIHIADVTDLYSPEIDSNNKLSYNPLDTQYAKVLRGAAENRGTSRYDLPLGPLHLLPPVGLEALSLQTEKIGSSRNSKNSQLNRCVTLWVYIDERTGRLIDAGLERTIISAPVPFTFKSASELLQSDSKRDYGFDLNDPLVKKSKSLIAIAERNLSLWSKYHKSKNDVARKREERMKAKEMISKQMTTTIKGSNNKNKGGFQRTRGHLIVDSALDLYAFGLSTLLKRQKANIPRASGGGSENRGGRLGTAPLRRYIDGMAQRQAVSVLCDGYGGRPMTREECTQANKIVGRANNLVNNMKAMKKTKNISTTTTQQRDALRSLSRHLAALPKNKNAVKAISTGRENEVIIVGSGAVAKCKDVKGSLNMGENLFVKVTKLDPEKGSLSVRLMSET